MTGKVMVDEETIDAAGMAVRGIESGRRVGWAKAFDAMRRADTAERDINMVRSDIRLLGNFAARAYGALHALLPDSLINQLFRGDNHEIKTYFPDGPYRSGEDAAKYLLHQSEVRIVAARGELNRLREEKRELDDKAFRAARRKELNRLSHMFGFVNVEVMFEYLSKSPTHDCEALGCYRIRGRCGYHFGNKGYLIEATPPARKDEDAAHS